MAVLNNYGSVVEYLITSGADVNAVDNVNCFIVSACINYIELLQFQATSLHYAAGNGHVSVVEYLVTSGAEVNSVDNVSCTF